MFWSTAIFLAIDRINAVFPIAGRAAIIIRSDGCQPPVSLSTALNPEGTPERPQLSTLGNLEQLSRMRISYPLFTVRNIIKLNIGRMKLLLQIKPN